MWVAKLVWAKLHMEPKGVFMAVKYKMCSTINGSHLPKKGAKKGQCYWDKNCKHMKNQELFVNRKADTMLQMVRNTIIRESHRKYV